jgi:hypothetical protein
MHASSSGAVREIAQWLLPVFVARFLANGNRYDTDPSTRTRFTDEDMDELNHKYNIDSEQCKRFATKAYFKHKSEEAFRDYIGVPEPGKNVRNIYSCKFLGAFPRLFTSGDMLPFLLHECLFTKLSPDYAM